MGRVEERVKIIAKLTDKGKERAKKLYNLEEPLSLGVRFLKTKRSYFITYKENGRYKRRFISQDEFFAFVNDTGLATRLRKVWGREQVEDMTESIRNFVKAIDPYALLLFLNDAFEEVLESGNADVILALKERLDAFISSQRFKDLLKKHKEIKRYF